MSGTIGPPPGDNNPKALSRQSKSTPTRSIVNSLPKRSAINVALSIMSQSVRPSRAPWRRRNTSLCTTPPLSLVRTRTPPSLLRGAEAGGASIVLLGLSLPLQDDRARRRSRSRAVRSPCRNWRRRLCRKRRMRRKTTLHGVAADELRS
jgi:hypothetical protein